MTIPLLPFINKLTDHLVSIRSDRWTSPHDPGPKLMAGREKVIENDGWHWEQSPESPQGAITCLIPLQINAGTNPKTDTLRQNLIRLPFLPLFPKSGWLSFGSIPPRSTSTPAPDNFRAKASLAPRWILWYSYIRGAGRGSRQWFQVPGHSWIQPFPKWLRGEYLGSSSQQLWAGRWATHALVSSLDRFMQTKQRYPRNSHPCGCGLRASQ